ncbi:DUF72 domain-containing protein [Thermus thermamylovorans]|uniref:DUF72 domain-containing protein n=1 Tax=Thermus thermamylovorans TaxID=2509362 RepID=A0A4Q9B6S2_9DEIN|nr:DUF72 domain-containing protein [Thermus thermamylovorans]
MLLQGLRGYRGYPGGFRAYRQAFPTVELSWWHRVGDPRTIGRLRALAPEGFRFSVHGHRHLTFLPSGEERRVLRRFLRRFRLFGPKAGAVRLQVPEGVDPGALALWLDLLEGILEEVGPVALAFQAEAALKPLLRERGYALVNEAGGPFLYLVDPEEVREAGEGYLYRSPGGGGA